MKNQYIVGKSQTKDGEKRFFGRVESVDRGILSGYHEKGFFLGGSNRKTFEIPMKDVLLSLGENPAPGSVYGFDVTNRFYKKKFHDTFGMINFMYRVDKAAAQKIFSAFDEAAKILKRNKLEVPSDLFSWQVQNKATKGKWAGWYLHSKDTEKMPHQFGIKPESLPDSDWVYVILHEVAHHIHRSAMTGKKLNAAWIRLFNTSIKLQTFKKEVMSSLLEELVSGETPPSEFKSGLEEDRALAFTWALRMIRADHAVSVRELDILFEADAKEEIRKVWPSRTLHKKDLSPVVSEYATKSYHELVAESVAFYLTKRKLPANIVSLVDKSLSFARANTGASPDE